MADRLLGKCKECAKADVKARYEVVNGRADYERERAKRPERKADGARYLRSRRKNHPERDAARAKVGFAVRSGKLKRLPCEVCSDSKTQAHHDNYLKPLEVKWLCFKHHREREHGQTIRQKAA